MSSDRLTNSSAIEGRGGGGASTVFYSRQSFRASVPNKIAAARRSRCSFNTLSSRREAFRFRQRKSAEGEETESSPVINALARTHGSLPSLSPAFSVYGQRFKWLPRTRVSSYARSPARAARHVYEVSSEFTILSSIAEFFIIIRPLDLRSRLKSRSIDSKRSKILTKSLPFNRTFGMQLGKKTSIARLNFQAFFKDLHLSFNILLRDPIVEIFRDRYHFSIRDEFVKGSVAKNLDSKF